MPASAMVRLMFSGAISSSSVEYLYSAPQSVVRAEPKSGTGGTLVTLVGTGFVSGDGAACFFGREATPLIRIVSSSKAICASPTSSVIGGNVSVTFSSNGIDLASTVASYTRLSSAVHSISPTFGPVSASTPIELFGIGFSIVATPACCFGDVSVPAVVVSDTTATCSAPPRVAQQAARDSPQAWAS